MSNIKSKYQTIKKYYEINNEKSCIYNFFTRQLNYKYILKNLNKNIN